MQQDRSITCLLYSFQSCLFPWKMFLFKCGFFSHIILLECLVLQQNGFKYSNVYLLIGQVSFFFSNQVVVTRNQTQCSKQNIIKAGTGFLSFLLFLRNKISCLSPPPLTLFGLFPWPEQLDLTCLCLIYFGSAVKMVSFSTENVF